MDFCFLVEVNNELSLIVPLYKSKCIIASRLGANMLVLLNFQEYKKYSDFLSTLSNVLHLIAFFVNYNGKKKLTKNGSSSLKHH